MWRPGETGAVGGGHVWLAGVGGGGRVVEGGRLTIARSRSSAALLL